MGSPSELSLDYRPNGYSTAMKPFGDQADQTQKLEEFLARLEEERLKIEAFKRELPLCMQLLNNAMEAYRQQLEMYHNTNQGTRPLLEEFIPLKHAGTATEGVEKLPEGNGASSEKAGWMTSAQLWSPADGAMQAAAPQGNADTSFDVSPKAVLDNKQRHGGAFLPFTKERHSRGRPGVGPELALAPMEKEKSEKKLSDMEGARRESCGKVGHEQGKVVSNGASDGGGQAAAAAAQSHRKARRCWTPELHRRFVNALQMLGGSQVATPKQIRELMKVDGLTNDEVKSHLQKYRLHTRRPIPAPSAPASVAAPQLVVLGGIWVPPEYATTAAAGPVIYGGHAAAAAHFCAGPPVQQDFYSPPLQPTPYLPLQLQHDHGVAAAATAASGPAYKVKDESPLSDMRGRQERSESIEDGEEEVDGDDEVEEEEEEEEGRQSESSSWKEGDEKSLGSVVEYRCGS